MIKRVMLSLSDESLKLLNGIHYIDNDEIRVDFATEVNEYKEWTEFSITINSNGAYEVLVSHYDEDRIETPVITSEVLKLINSILREIGCEG